MKACDDEPPATTAGQSAQNGQVTGASSELADGDDWTEVNRLLAENRLRDRGYASYGQWPSDKPLTERDAARVLMRTISASQGQEVSTVESRGRDDPPDCQAELSDGGSIGIELVELVSAELIQAHQLRERAVRKGREPSANAAQPGDVWWCDEIDVATELQRLIAKKDIPLKDRKGGPYDLYVVLITTDEYMVTPDLAKRVSEIAYTAQFIDGAYLLLSYNPGTEDLYPEGRPIFELQLMK